MKLHHIEAAGTPRAIAAAVGETLRADIQTAYALHQEKLHKNTAGQWLKKLATLQRAAKKYFPNLITELHGLAAGARVTLHDALVFSFEEELLSTTDCCAGERCSAFAIRDGEQFWFGHNEDWDIALPLYVLRARPQRAPAYVAVGNAGQLPGTVAGLNEYGVAYSGNSIYGPTSDRGLPKTMCLRSFLDARSLAEIITLVRRPARTLGNNSVLVSLPDRKIATLEWSAHALAYFEPTANFFVHTNHYVLPTMLDQQTKPPSRSSHFRYRRLNRLLAHLPHPTLGDLQKIMSDHAYNPHGLCRHGRSKTLASIIMDVTAREIHVAYRSPCQNPYQKFAL